VSYDDPVRVFASAARTFAQLVREIPANRWDGPGLGEWDMRSLVGHTSRSLTTVISYSETTADREEIGTPQDYYVRIAHLASDVDPKAIVERGRRAGRELGDDPVATIDELVEQALDVVTRADNPLIQVIGGLGIRLLSYLPTRTFELAVHILDIARAAEIPFTLPDEVTEAATVLAARIAVASGVGETVLMALTGRSPLPPSFSVV
jgi:uncharacterized protein (TIGR03083 family)